MACEAKNRETEAQLGIGNTWHYTGQPTTSSENFGETAYLKNKVLIYVSCWIVLAPVKPNVPLAQQSLSDSGQAGPLKKEYKNWLTLYGISS